LNCQSDIKTLLSPEGEKETVRLLERRPAELEAMFKGLCRLFILWLLGGVMVVIGIAVLLIDILHPQGLSAFTTPAALISFSVAVCSAAAGSLVLARAIAKGVLSSIEKTQTTTDWENRRD